MTNEEILKEEFNLLRLDLITHYEFKGMKASGEWANELEGRVSGLTGSLFGLNYSQQLEEGREPTSGGSSGETLLERIKRWIEDKGIRPLEASMKVSTLAFLITRKIHREGWKREKHGGVNLISEVITPERVQRIIDRVSQFNISAFTTEMKNVYKEFETVN